MAFPQTRSARGSSDLNTRYQRISSHQQQQEQQRQRQQSHPTHSATTHTWTSQPVPEPPLMPPLVDLANWIASLPPFQQWPSLLVDRLLLAPVSLLLQYTRDIILSPRTHRIVIRLGVLATIFWFALAAAVISYVGFYRAWVPDVGLRKELWLQYGHDRPPYAHLYFESAGTDNPLREPNPSSSSYNPSSDITGEFFAQDQAYDVTLELSIPLNQANLDLGNFMVDLDLKSKANRSVFHVSKPTLLTYSAAPLRAVSSLSQLIAGNPPPSQVPVSSQLLRIPLLRRAILRPSSQAPPFSSSPPDPRSDRKVTHGEISVGRADADKFWIYGGNHNTLAGIHTLPGNGRVVPLAVGSHSSRGELQTYGANLRFDAHLTGLRFFMYHFPLLSFFTFTTLFLAFEMATALTLWAVAAIYTSSMTIAPLSLETEEHFQPLDKPSRYAPRRGRDEYTEDGIKTESETTPSGEEMSSFERRYAQRDEEEEETDTETEARRRVKREREPRIKVEDFDDDEIFGGADQGEEDKEMRLRSLESLQAKDAADLAEAIRQSRMRDLLEARRMGGAGPSGSASTALLPGEGLIDVIDPTAPISPDELSEIQLSRRVLDRLDEETEEDTDVGSSRPSSRLAATFAPAGSGGAAGGPGGETDPWEDLEGDSGSSESAAEASGVRQRRQHKDDEEDLHESTIGGVSIHFQSQRTS